MKKQLFFFLAVCNACCLGAVGQKNFGVWDSRGDLVKTLQISDSSLTSKRFEALMPLLKDGYYYAVITDKVIPSNYHIPYRLEGERNFLPPSAFEPDVDAVNDSLLDGKWYKFKADAGVVRIRGEKNLTGYKRSGPVIVYWNSGKILSYHYYVNNNHVFDIGYNQDGTAADVNLTVDSLRTFQLVPDSKSAFQIIEFSPRCQEGRVVDLKDKANK